MRYEIIGDEGDGQMRVILHGGSESEGAKSNEEEEQDVGEISGGHETHRTMDVEPPTSTGDGESFPTLSLASSPSSPPVPPASSALSNPSAMAPEFPAVHSSWALFDQHLQSYARQSYQLYVIRTTTSVKRRNQRIADLSSAAASSRRLEERVEDAQDARSTPQIPEHWQWYSKTLVCTHGWKDRRRGLGKRTVSAVRSTGCPVKICVTLQRSDAGSEESSCDNRGAGVESAQPLTLHDGVGAASTGERWQIVVTKHVRKHNHLLTKELYLFYTENRRNYDPELLSVFGQVEAHSATSEQMSGDDRPSTCSRPLMVADATEAAFPMLENPNDTRDQNRQRAPLECGEKGFALATGVLEAQKQGVGQQCVIPKMARKAFGSWDEFHREFMEYAHATKQQFRIRSSTSVHYRNSKVIQQREKAGQNFQVQQIPECYKWYSKLLICNHGWKRKSRSKSTQSETLAEDSDMVSTTLDAEVVDGARLSSNYHACGAMVMARLQRDVHENWCIVINRQVLNHNHELVAEQETSRQVNTTRSRKSNTDTDKSCSSITTANRESEPESFIESLASATFSDSEHNSAPKAVDAPDSIETRIRMDSVTQNSMRQEVDSSVNGTTATTLIFPEAAHDPSMEGLENARNIVVRVPRLSVVYESWADFHASLQEYSERTYQSYRTRTTSSVSGRNQKIDETMAAQGKLRTGDSGSMASQRVAISPTSLNNARVDAEDGSNSISARVETAHRIPDHYKWYSKTLTCTHGWKERRRGSGKRAVHVVRSTECPVKICATLRYVNPSGRSRGEANLQDLGWRIVVTKHVVDHNHNLSRELFQHYCDNRRIYDRDLLAIEPLGAAQLPSVPSLPLSSHTTVVVAPATEVTQLVRAVTGGHEQDIQRGVLQGEPGTLQETQLHPRLPVSASLGGQTTVPEQIDQTGMCTTESTVVNGTVTQLSSGSNVVPIYPGGMPLIMQYVYNSHSSTYAPLQEYGTIGSHSISQRPTNSTSVQGAPTMAVMTSSPAESDVQSAVPAPTVIDNLHAGVSGDFHSNSSIHEYGIPLFNSGSTHNLPQPSQNPGPGSMGAPSESHSRRRRHASIEESAVLSEIPQESISQPPMGKKVRRLDGQDREENGFFRSQNQCATPDQDGDYRAYPDRQTSANFDRQRIDESSTADVTVLSMRVGSTGPVWSVDHAIQVSALTMNDGRTIWRAPRMKRRHASWASFTEYLNAYSAATYQLYRVRTTSSIAARNARITQQMLQLQASQSPSDSSNGMGDRLLGLGRSTVGTRSSLITAALTASLGGDPDTSIHTNACPLLVPVDYEWYSKTYVCTHGWKARRRGKGHRVSHTIRSTACPVKLCATLQRDPQNPARWHVIVTKHVVDHNHEISVAMFQSYSENRRIRDPTLLARAQEMWRDGKSRRKIFEFLKDETHQNILMKDVHNLVQRWQQQAMTSGEQVLEAISPSVSAVDTALEEVAVAIPPPEHEPPKM